MEVIGSLKHSDMNVEDKNGFCAECGQITGDARSRSAPSRLHNIQNDGDKLESGEFWQVALRLILITQQEYRRQKPSSQ